MMLSGWVGCSVAWVRVDPPGETWRPTGEAENRLWLIYMLGYTQFRAIFFVDRAP